MVAELFVIASVTNKLGEIQDACAGDVVKIPGVPWYAPD